MCVCVLLFFFFKQKTAYEMRISDWSSDVCSSDLQREHFLLVSVETGKICTQPHGGVVGEPLTDFRGMNRQRRDRSWRRRRLRGTRRDADTGGQAEQQRDREQMAHDGFLLIVMVAAWRSEEHTSELQSLMRI